MEALSFRIALATILVAFIAHRGYYTRRMRRNAEEILEQPDLGRGAEVAKGLALLAFGATSIYLLVPSWIAWASIPLPDWLRWLGFVAALLGFGLLEWSQRSLGASWSDAPSLLEGQELVERGPYRWVRHPIYTAFLIILGATLPISANGLVGGAWLVMTSLDIRARIRVEEQLMVDRFGEAYRDYMRRTGRLLPRMSSGRP